MARAEGGELTFETETGRYTRFHLDLPVGELAADVADPAPGAEVAPP